MTNIPETLGRAAFNAILGFDEKANGPGITAAGSKIIEAISAKGLTVVSEESVASLEQRIAQLEQQLNLTNTFLP